MKNWIMNFLSDERGMETVEFGVGAATVGAGSAAGYTTLKDNLQDLNAGVIDSIGVDSN